MYAHICLFSDKFILKNSWNKYVKAFGLYITFFVDMSHLWLLAMLTWTVQFILSGSSADISWDFDGATSTTPTLIMNHLISDW